MYKLTTPQQNIWNLQKFYNNTSIGNLCGACFFDEKLDYYILSQAINAEIKAQTALRLRFSEENGNPVQQVCDYKPIEIPFREFESMSEFDRFANNFAKEPIGLIDRQMFRVSMIEVEGKSGIIFVVSHLICDAWTFSLLIREIDSRYKSIKSGTTGNDVEHSYLEFVESEQKYLSSGKYIKDKTFWEEKYSEKPDASAIRYTAMPVRSPSASRYSLSVSKELTRRINNFCDAPDVTQAVLFETAMFAYLSQINVDSRKITVGIPVLNRTGIEEKNTAGMFISTTPLTVAVSPEDTAALLYDRINECHMALFRHQRYPYSHILSFVRDAHEFNGRLFDVMVSYQDAKTETDVKTKWYCNGYSEIPFALHIDNRDSSESYTITVDYQTNIFTQPDEIDLIVKRLLFVIEQIMDDPDIKVSDINYVPDAERYRIIYDFNSTDVDFQRDKCVHELFCEQVKQTSDEIALVFRGAKYSYKKIDEMSNSLAHYLRDNYSLKPNDTVPIVAQRSQYVIIAMLAVMKAGGAYMLVDPTYPMDRIEYMLDIAKSKIALNYGYNKILPINSMKLDGFDYSYNCNSIENINNPEDLCYIVFTSGSTGKPKGVSICHRNVVNYCDNNRFNVCGKLITDKCRSIVSVTNTIFDIFVTESILPLLNGKTIYFADDNEVVMQNQLSRLITDNNVEVLQTTPTKMRSYILDKENVAYLEKLKVIILGGEAFPPNLYTELRKYTNAEIYNIYGPAETTVWSTNAKVSNSDITVGKPIANTQIYILDQNKQLLPIGIAGEICISGDGVGKGYLNRPDLTSERFISDPFVEGRTMYCTGDLALWRYSGEIEYLGRIDTQVKIRGLRIELSEIESVMSSFEGIKLAAATDKRDETGRQYLVGYYTSDIAIDEFALRKLLSSKLPKYMVPNYFMKLAEMPMTASGKTDRKNLPVPDLTNSTDDYVAPETENEKIICKLLEEMLSVDKVGINDDFFGLGGDSLMAIEFITKAHNKGIELPLQSVFDHPTARELGKYLENGKEKQRKYDANDFLKYSEILSRNVIDDSFVPVKHSLGNVLLTGATGFLGSHIIDELIKNDTGKVYCLVRGDSSDNCCTRLIKVLEHYFGDKYNNDIGKRIIPVLGDITLANLSDNIPEDVQTIIHTAATVKHYGSYDYFHSINVNGTQNVINFAKYIGAKLIHISTLSVSGNSLADDFSVYRSSEKKYFYETSLFIDQPLDNVYIRSKFEAEMAVLDAVLDGLDAKIIRVGNLTNRESDLKFQPNYRSNAFLTRFKAITELGMFPDYLMPLYAEFSPIDKTAEGVVKIAQYAKNQSIFHLYSNKPIYFSDLLEVLHDLRIKMEVVDAKTFSETMQKIAKDTNMEYIFEAFQNDMDEDGKLVYDSNISLVNDFTVDFLKRVGFEWKQTDAEYIGKYIDYFRKLGYLEV